MYMYTTHTLWMVHTLVHLHISMEHTLFNTIAATKTLLRNRCYNWQWWLLITEWSCGKNSPCQWILTLASPVEDLLHSRCCRRAQLDTGSLWVNFLLWEYLEMKMSYSGSRRCAKSLVAPCQWVLALASQVEDLPPFRNENVVPCSPPSSASRSKSNFAQAHALARKSWLSRVHTNCCIHPAPLRSHALQR